MNLQEARKQYKPKIPQLLREKIHFQLGSDTASKGDVDEIKKRFPETYGQPLAFGKMGEEKTDPLTIGVVLSGGQAAGGHNVITGLFDCMEGSLIGFQGGPGGVIHGDYKQLDKDTIDFYRNSGGFDMIGSGRDKIESEEDLAKSLKVCQDLKLDGLVIIGGDDSNTNAAVLAEYFKKNGYKISVIGVPKTIDGDLKTEHIETSFGFDTATKVYSEMIGNLCRDALSAKKYTHFVKLMGRSASHVTLECAVQTHPNVTLIGEEIAGTKQSLNDIVKYLADVIEKRSQNGKNYGVILIPEGLIEFIPEKEALVKDLDLDLDPHGNLQVSHIRVEEILIEKVKEELKTRNFSGKFSPVAHFFGYEGRSGFPTNFDANYCYALGFLAAHLIKNELTGYICCMRNLTRDPTLWEPWGIPITSLLNMEERKGNKKPVIQKALVDLNGRAFAKFKEMRQKWETDDEYQCPGPIQFAGEIHITESFPQSL
ncbi:MAG: Pyrophosphate--fructose 6-phosphate 1-phosphotransferase [Chlamydiia bacterium]|nr:Pyrophosphate--fructose 6-phosphate 1-phosphotransferase [Chlamydiia bacterium]MCH9615771.1 Pyrophosphate--fructose 6-phosphate 1-phosphotransferase [Chlamydiia bacterium]MCH9628826.1 Pyrophosphate--fructose 6-phosphate 1-phosphotransferase [Chlamydiia bacterium]